MPDGHRQAIPQITAVDKLFGTHRQVLAVLVLLIRRGGRRRRETRDVAFG
jgi:hypothetical protein